MLGVWDTVGALGIPGHLFGIFDQAKYGFLDTTLNPCIQNAYHAVSIDERRASFMPTLWTSPDGSPRDNDAQLKQVWFPACIATWEAVTLRINSQTSRCGGWWTTPRLAALCLMKIGSGCLGPMPFNPIGPAHDEWKLIPWGIAQHRTVPANAVLSNTVKVRIAKSPGYRPQNLTDRSADSYRQVEVIPDKDFDHFS